MAGPTIAYNNLFSAGSIITASAGIGSVDLIYPYSNVFHKFPQKAYRSSHQNFVIDATNNKLDFSVTSGGGTPQVATVPSGSFRGEELAATLATLMNQAAGVSDISVVYNRTSKAFTISKASGFLYLKWATGANKSNSMGATLQFLTSADASGSLTYTGEADAIGTGGKYVLTSSNNQLHYNDGTNRTATIPAGTYSAKGLATEIKAQMDSTSGVTNFHVNFYPTLKGFPRWNIFRASGTITLRTTVSTNAIWGVLGYDTGADKSGSSSYAGDYRRIHTEESPAVIDLGSAVNITFVAVAGINLDTAAAGGTFSLILESNSTDSWTSPTSHGAPTAQSLDRANQKGWAYWQINQSHRYWRIKIINNDNLDGYVQIGVLFGGTTYTLGTNYKLKTHTQRRQTFTEKQITDQGATYGSIKARLFEAEMEFQKFIQADKNFVDGMVDTVADINPFAILLDPTGLTTPKFVWANFIIVPEFKEYAPHQGGSIWTCDNWRIREAG